LIRINAYLLALRELAKSFATSMGYIEPTGEDNKSEEQKAIDDLLGSTEGAEENWENINDQVDEYKEKLLGFDKFQVLSSVGAGETDSEIDNILKELQKAKDEYQGILDQSQNIALFGDAEKNIKGAYDILKDWGFEYDEQSKQWLKDGKTVKQIVEEIAQSLKGVITLMGLFTKPWLVLAVYIEKAYLTDEQFRNSVNQLLSALSSALTNVLPALVKVIESFLPIITGIINGFAKVITYLDSIGMLEEVVWLVVGAMLAWKAVNLTLGIVEVIGKVKELITHLPNLAKVITDATGKLDMLKVSAYACAAIGIYYLLDGFYELFNNWDDMSNLERLVSILKMVAGAALIAASAISIMNVAKAGKATNMGGPIAAALAIGAGLAIVTASLKSAKTNAQEIGAFANGGKADKGSLFYAGEAGPELVTQTSGGGSTIMNMKQLEDAVARGFIRGFMSTDKGDTSDNSSDVYIDGQKVFNVMRGVARRNGYDFAKV
ncbi:MAG: hypothetical protein U0M06_11000, partial [Clostridia bacterium]|nr:hypothetical protein [Clostridia bacterium]